MEKEIDKNSKENKGKVTKKVCKTIDNKMILTCKIECEKVKKLY